MFSLHFITTTQRTIHLADTVWEATKDTSFVYFMSEKCCLVSNFLNSKLVSPFPDFRRSPDEPVVLGPARGDASDVLQPGHKTQGDPGIAAQRPRHPDPAGHPVEGSPDQPLHPRGPAQHHPGDRACRALPVPPDRET